MGIDGDPKTYGLFTGKPVKGKVYSIRPTKLPTIRPKHNEVLEVPKLKRLMSIAMAYN